MGVTINKKLNFLIWRVRGFFFFFQPAGTVRVASKINLLQSSADSVEGYSQIYVLLLRRSQFPFAHAKTDHLLFSLQLLQKAAARNLLILLVISKTQHGFTHRHCTYIAECSAARLSYIGLIGQIWVSFTRVRQSFIG